jgi:hypothetical protein
VWIGRLRPASPYIGNVQGPRGSLIGNYPYQQPLPYNYQQGVVYPYGVTAYGPEYMYSQSQVDNGYEHLLLFLFVIKLSSNFGYVFSCFMV